jgi:HSP20 family molecular chaperone IbpA
VYFCEFGQKTLFRRFDLPEGINTDKVTANLDKGILQLTATKARQKALPTPAPA